MAELNFIDIKVGDRLILKSRITLVRKTKTVVFEKGNIVEVVEKVSNYKNKRTTFTVDGNGNSIRFKDWEIPIHFELVGDL